MDIGDRGFQSRNIYRKALTLQNKEETKESKVSTTESEIGYYVKGEREKSIAYSFHTALLLEVKVGFVYGLHFSFERCFLHKAMLNNSINNRLKGIFVL